MSGPGAPIRRADAQRRLLRTLFQWRWTALLFFAFFMGFTLMIAYWFPPLYKAEAKILVKAGRQMEPLVAAPISQFAAGYRTSLEDVNSEIEILLNRPVMERAADEIIAEQGPPSPEKKKSSPVGAALDAFKSWAAGIGLVPQIEAREKLILHLGTEITVEPVPMSSIIELTYTNFSAKAAAGYVNHVLDAYLAQHALVHATPGAYVFFSEQAAEYQRQLQPVEQALTAFKVANDGGDLTLKENLLLQRIAETEDALRSLGGLSEGEEDLLDGALLENRELEAIRERLLTLRLRLTEERFRYGPESPEIRALESQIAAARSDLALQLERTEAVMRRNLEELRAELRVVQVRSAEYDRLVEQERQLRGTRDQYLAKAEEERIAGAMDEQQMLSVRILERPQPPVKAWFPNRFVLFVLGIFLGIPGAITAALLRGYFHARVATVEDVEEHVGAPVLGSVRQFWWFAFRDGIPARMLDAVRPVLVAAGRQSGLKVLHVAASSRREGVRSVAAAIAQVAAEQAGSRVVLAVRGEHPPTRGAEVLQLESMTASEAGAAVRAARERSDLVVLAGPPLADGLGASFAALGDASVLVISGRGVHIEAARRALQVLRRCAPALVGAVLTRRRDPIPWLLYRRV